jgi:HTH-type transcriptional regulator/antitoxin HigA
VLLKLLVKIIEDYEEKIYEIKDWANVSPSEILEHFIESKGLSTEELIKIMGSEKIVNGIRKGKEKINKIQAQILGNYFEIFPNLFLNI